MKSITIKSIAVYAVLARPEALFAHDGHGLAGGHWHATDAWGFAALGLAIAAAIWLSRSGK
jgi:hypothetical protein